MNAGTLRPKPPPARAMPRSRSPLHKPRRNWRNDADWTDDERKRRSRVLKGETVVATLRTGTDECLLQWAQAVGRLVRIDRRSEWGNPFWLGADGDRARVCKSFEIYFERKPSLQAKLSSLRGKVLACWCYPERCHGDHLAQLANQTLRAATVLRTASVPRTARTAT